VTCVKIGVEHTLDDRTVLDFVAAFSTATFFHSPAWLAVLEASFRRFRTAWITAREGGELVGIMPMAEVKRGPFRLLWALPFGTYGHPLAHDPAVRTALLEMFIGLASSPSCLEAAASFFDGAWLSDVPPSACVRMEECCLIELGGGYKDFWQGALSSKRRQLCNRGLRAGITVRSLETEGEVRAFHALYVAGSRAWGGVHPYPLRFFLELFKQRDRGVVFWGGFLEDTLLGGNIDFYFGEMAQAWQAGISSKAYPYHVGSLLVACAVEEAYRRGLKLFNLGSSGGDEGLIFFKKSFGGTEFVYPVLEMKKRWWGWLRRR